MQKILSICFVILTFVSCKDEINIPESGSYVDGDPPIISILSPDKDSTYNSSQDIPLHITLKDNYNLDSFELLIRTEFTQDSVLYFDTTITDSFYTYLSHFSPLSTDSADYEIFVNAYDEVGNNNNLLITITAK
ncbi:MAG: hypothetical protein ACPGYY_06520 [Bacteroidia bacterium]